MIKTLRILTNTFHTAVLTASLCGCMKWDYEISEEFNEPAPGLFIINEGNFQYGNASLSFYNPANEEILNEVFIKANGFKLGDVAQSMTIHDNTGWIVVNNSHVIFAIDCNTFKEKGRIIDLTSPRYIHFVNDTKAYVTQLWDNRIFIIDPRSYSITGYIEVPDMTMETGSTEQMVQQGKYVYVTCWSYQNRILKIDTETDKIEGTLEVGRQPRSITTDSHGKLWVMTDGGLEGSPYGSEEPRLLRIDPERLAIERTWKFDQYAEPRELQTNGTGDRLYWIDDDVWSMSVDSGELPERPIIESRGTIYYGLTVSPDTGDIYVADAIDYQQPGTIYRYNMHGELQSHFSTGVNPGAFAWKTSRD